VIGSAPVPTMDIRPALQGAAAADMLIGRLRGDAVEAPIITPAELRVRASTER
jgi:DNA-binding LacI/PurR family transcriptional regulator